MPLNFVRDLAKRVFRPAISKVLINEYVFPEEEVRRGGEVENLRIIHPAERIQWSSPETDPFVPLGKYYKQGWFDRPDIFVCEIPEARYHVPSGLICTRSFKAVMDNGLEYRRFAYPPFTHRRPLSTKPLAGVYSSIHKYDSNNFWHWLFDCVPKIHSLAKAMPSTPITFLMPESASEFQREILRAVVPAPFKVQYLAEPEWVQSERFVWTSLMSDRCMGFLPQDYYAAIRDPIFKQYGLTAQHTKKERLYISRSGAKHRRILNEDAMVSLLEEFGFRKVLAENLSFKEQVELFHRAEIIIGPHGAGIGAIFFSGDIDVVVLYPTRIPPNYFHSMAMGLGQRHHFLLHDETDEDASFTADLPALRRMLQEDLHLSERKA